MARTGGARCDIVMLPLALLLALTMAAAAGRCYNALSCPANQQGFQPRRGVPMCHPCDDDKYKPEGTGCCVKCAGIMIVGVCTPCLENSEGAGGWRMR